MTYLEPVPVPDRYLEPVEPGEWICGVCDQEWSDCECLHCDECGERGETTEMTVDDDTFTICPKCAKAMTS